MKSPTDPFKNRSLDEAIQWFFKEGTIDLASQPSNFFFKAFAEHISSPKLPSEHKVSAQMKLDALREVYSIHFENSFRDSEKGKEALSPPSGFALTPEGNLVVSDDFNHRIQIYDKTFKLIAQFGSKGKNPGELHYPKGLAADPEGNIYVADSWNHRVQKFNAQGKFLSSFGSYGNESGQMNEPYAVHIDPMRNLVVVERYNHRIQVFSPDGTSLGWIGNRGTLMEEKLAYLFETPSALISSPVFEFPTSIACDSQHHYYIADSGNHRIVKFNPEWRQVQTIGEQGNQPGQFQYPMCVSVGPNDLIYVADLNNDRIQVFTSQGQFLFAFSESSTPVKMPCLTLVDAQNRLYLGLTFSTKISIFNAPSLSLDTIYGKQIQIQPDNFRNRFYQGKLFQESGATDIAAVSYAKGVSLLLGGNGQESLTSDDMDSLLQFSHLHAKRQGDKDHLLRCLDIFDGQIQAIQQKIETTHREWDMAATEFGRQLAVKEDSGNSLTFDKELYLAEKKDKTLFRELRLSFYEHKKTSDAYAQFTHALLQSPESAVMCGANLRKRLDRICGLINHYLDIKEKNEETMIDFFAKSPDDREKWRDFRSKSSVNTRIMDVLKRFHYELKTVLRSIKSAALEYPLAPWTNALLAEMFICPEKSHTLFKILLRNHEFFYELDNLLKDLIDTWINWNAGPFSTIILKADDLKPIPYDIEEVRTEDMLRSALIEGMPLRQTNEGLACGDKTYHLAENNSGQLAVQLEVIYKNQDVYEEKHSELYKQLDTLQEQRLELEIQLRQADVRDKKAAIPINKNIQIIDFQTDLTLRMLVTLEINEINNITRLLLCGALLAVGNGNKPPIPPIFITIRNYHGTLESKISELRVKRKNLFYEIANAEISLKQLNQDLGAGTLEQILGMKKQLTQLKHAHSRAEIFYGRYVRIKNTFDKLTDFIDEAFAQPIKKKLALKLKFSFGLGGPLSGKFTNPIGLARTPEGNTLIVDSNSHRVLQYTSKGTYLSEFGQWGSLFGLFKYPHNLAMDANGYIYVADSQNQRVQKFTKQGEFVLAFGSQGNSKKDVGPCFSLSVDRENNIWVVNAQNHRINIYNSDGEYIRSAGKQGANPEDIFQPTCICCFDNGDYIIGDRSAYLLKRFNAQDRLLNVLQKGGMDFEAFYFAASHPALGIFVTETWMDRILHLDSELKIISVFDQSGRRGGQLSKVCDLSIAGDTLTAANHDSHRIHVFELPINSNGCH